MRQIFFFFLLLEEVICCPSSQVLLQNKKADGKEGDSVKRGKRVSDAAALHWMTHHSVSATFICNLLHLYCSLPPRRFHFLHTSLTAFPDVTLLTLSTSLPLPLWRVFSSWQNFENFSWSHPCHCITYCISQSMYAGSDRGLPHAAVTWDVHAMDKMIDDACGCQNCGCIQPPLIWLTWLDRQHLTVACSVGR